MTYKGFLVPALFLGLVIFLGVESEVRAGVITVCPSGCDYSGLQAAINGALAGDSIHISADTYKNPILIDKDVNLIGAGEESTIITNGLSPTDQVAIVTVEKGAVVSIEGVTITGGRKTNSGSLLDAGGGGIYNAGVLTLRASTVRNNETTGNTDFLNAYGGGIFNCGTLTLIESTVRNNKAVGSADNKKIIGGDALGGSGYGGGIYNINGSLALFKTTVSHNEANGGNGTAGAGGNGEGGDGLGGGIYTRAWSGGGCRPPSASVSLTNSTVSSNEANGGTGVSGDAVSTENLFGTGGTAAGGGIFNLGGLTGFDPLSSLHLTSSTVSQNVASGGEGIDGDGSDGHPQGGDGFGGGITSNLSARMVNTIIAFNQAVGGPATNMAAGIPMPEFNGSGFGGGLDHGGTAFFQTAEYTAVVDNEPTDCRWTINSSGHNWESQTTCGFTDPTDVQNMVSGLAMGPLADNGGHTFTHALVGVPNLAVDGGGVNCPTTDQRGNLRPIDGLCDIGAFESGVNQAPLLNSSAQPALPTINKNETDSDGTLVSELIASVLPLDMITDANLRAEEGIAVIAVDSTNGTWQFDIPSEESGWNDMEDSSESAAFLLPSDDEVSIRFVPDPGFCGTVDPGITFRAWDLLGDFSDNRADTSSHGGSTPFSDNIETAAIIVNCRIYFPTVIK